MASRGFFAWALISLFYALQYIFRVMPNTLSGVVMDKFGVGAFALGQFSAIYYVGYTAAHIPLGVLIDRYGPKRVVPCCVALMVLGIVPLLFGSWKLVQLGRIMTGIGSAAAALSIFKVSNMYFGKKFAKMTSIAMVIGFLGAMYGGKPVLSLIEQFGWVQVFAGLIVLGGVLALMLACVLYDTAAVTKHAGIREEAKLVFCNKKLIAISILGGLLIGPLEGFADGWATPFLLEVCRLSAHSAVVLPSTIFVGSCIGSLMLSYLLEKSWNAFSMIICCGGVTVISFCLLLTGQCTTSISTFFILLTVGICTAYQLVTVCKAIFYVKQTSVALATAVSNMIIMIFGYFFHTSIASVIDFYWTGNVADGVPIYGSDVLVKSMLVIPVSALIGTVGYIIVKRKEES